MAAIVNQIGSIPIFKGLDEDQFTQVISIAERRNYRKGEIIFQEGDAGNGFYLVESGKVKIYKLSFEGKEHILHIYGPGKPFGEVPVFEGHNFPAHAQAMVKTSAIFFPREDFVALIMENPSLAMNMLAALSMRLREFTIMVENLALKEVPARLASYLLVLAKEHQGRSRMELPVSKSQIAGLLGTTPETISRAFAGMIQSGLINMEKKEIRLLDREGLTILSEQG